MNYRRIGYAVLVLGIALAWFGGCSTSNSSSSGPPGPAGLNGKGICEDTCAKPCAADGDCETSTGEKCCDYGQSGKVCHSAKSCPTFCSSDQNCDTTRRQS